jgi:hypothetical protein
MKFFSRWMARNPLKRLDSDERIQENQTALNWVSAAKQAGTKKTQTATASPSKGRRAR